MQPGGIREDKRNAHPWILPRLIQAALHAGEGYGHGGCQVFLIPSPQPSPGGRGDPSLKVPPGCIAFVKLKG